MSKQKFFALLITPFFLFPSLLHPDPLKPEETNPYILLSIPKSGSHLIAKLLRMISNTPYRSMPRINEFGNDRAFFPPHKLTTVTRFFELFPGTPKQSIHSHFNYGYLLQTLAERHPEYARIILIRDPRDICVSATHYIDPVLNVVIGHVPFENKLLYVIDAEGYLRKSTMNIKKECEQALHWMRDPLATVCRFEALCGADGGGDRETQINEIMKVATALGAQLSRNEIESLASNLWGDTPTFRSGKTQEWKKHFTPKHKRHFKKRFGKILIQMGYEKDMNW